MPFYVVALILILDKYGKFKLKNSPLIIKEAA
jgi:hypothetical protein